jgi:hypothetical protein
MRRIAISSVRSPVSSSAHCLRIMRVGMHFDLDVDEVAHRRSRLASPGAPCPPIKRVRLQCREYCFRAMAFAS